VNEGVGREQIAECVVSFGHRNRGEPKQSNPQKKCDSGNGENGNALSFREACAECPDHTENAVSGKRHESCRDQQDERKYQ